MTSNYFYNMLTKIYSVIEALFIACVKAYLNTYIGQAFLSKFINYAVDKFRDEIINPLMTIVLVRVGYSYDVSQGRVLIEKLKTAEENSDASTYDSTVDDILS